PVENRTYDTRPPEKKGLSWRTWSSSGLSCHPSGSWHGCTAGSRTCCRVYTPRGENGPKPAAPAREPKPAAPARDRSRAGAAGLGPTVPRPEFSPSPPTPLPAGERGEEGTPLPSGERGARGVTPT